MNPSKVEEFRWQRTRSQGKSTDGKTTEGDMVFENASLFLRDALISREYAVKAGDSGRVLLVLKIWALSFRGNGRTKYAYEMLHVIHNLTNVFPVGLILNIHTLMMTLIKILVKLSSITGY